MYCSVTLASGSTESGPGRALSSTRSMHTVHINIHAEECAYPLSTTDPCSLSATNPVHNRKSSGCCHLDGVTMGLVGVSVM
ncbi:hypothetical protein BJX66DRAFT_42954 [Aspergillus keveii]|uniref:Uncharacterized protein n=1 Tax=Aspergillus keveii TaxID=714993 RepID=A0ABR4FRY0_9EURO